MVNVAALGNIPKMSVHLSKETGIMVWDAVSSDETKSPLVLIEEWVKVYSRVHQKMLHGYVLPWLSETFGSHYIFTKNSALVHTSKFSAELLKETFPWIFMKITWPPSCPDINPMNFVIWPIPIQKSHTQICQTGRKLLWSCGAIWTDDKKFLYFRWDKIKDSGETKMRTFWILHICKIFLINITIKIYNLINQDLICVILCHNE